MATGCGKTVVFAHVADLWPGRVLVIAHRDELIRQAAEKIQTVTGKPVAIEMGRERADHDFYGARVVIGSIQTLSRANRRARFAPDHFSLIIVDEGHHAVAVTYREVLNYFGEAKRLFVTATPKRGDQLALEQVCESVAFQYGIEPAIDDGWLVPIKQQVVQVDGLDFSKVRTVAQDFNASDLEKILTEEEPLHRMCSSAYEIIGDRQALWFCTSVAHAQAMSAVLTRYAGSSVRFLSGDTATEDRRAIVDEYKAGRVQHLLNCALFLEGFDAPTTSVIVMGRPTKSLSLYMQVLGRGTRPLPGIVDGLADASARREAIAISLKPSMTVIDYAGNAGRHKIVQATDVLGGKHSEAVRNYAKETAAREGIADDVKESLLRAELEMSLFDEETKRRKLIVAKAAYRVHEVDPFTKQYQPKAVPTNRVVELASDGQVRFIMSLSRRLGEGWTESKVRRLSKRQASGIIGTLRARAGV